MQVGGTTYYRITEVATLVGRDRSTLWRWKNAGKIPEGLRYCDRELLFTVSELEQIYSYAHRLEPDEARHQLRNQLDLFKHAQQ